MIHVSDCKAVKCPRLQRRMNGQYNTGPFYCAADKDRETIKILRRCPKNLIKEY